MIQRFGFNIAENEYETLIELRLKAIEIEKKTYSKLVSRATGDLTDKEVHQLALELLHIYNIEVDSWIDLKKKMYKILFREGL